MSDASVAAALRSQARLVVIEAPGGCGKTYQGAKYAADLAVTTEARTLILTHTHAAVDVFKKRTSVQAAKVEVRTIDSLIIELADAYHQGLGLPEDVTRWARTQENGYDRVAAKVSSLLEKFPLIARSLSNRYPVVICDEHQDTTEDQHKIIMSLYHAGGSLRIFGDPMQRIFGGATKALQTADALRWSTLKQGADRFEELETPHRWANANSALGDWILSARAALKSGGQVDLRGARPKGLRVLAAQNVARGHGQYQLNSTHSDPIYKHLNGLSKVLVLASSVDTVAALRPFFNRRYPIWEGHIREALDKLCQRLQDAERNPDLVAQAAVNFVEDTTIGFSKSAYSDRLIKEVAEGCRKACRGKPETLQNLGRLLVNAPDHRGVASFLSALRNLSREDSAFNQIKIDHSREFSDGISLGRFDSIEEGATEIARRRAHIRQGMPDKAISTIHKAKGLEFDHVVVAGCDKASFSNSERARARLYVAISRGTRTLTLLACPATPSPLFLV